MGTAMSAIFVIGMTVFSIQAIGEDDDLNIFGDHLKLAIKSPSNFGFIDEESARSAKAGNAYPFFTVKEWEELQGSVEEAVASPPKKMIEVLDGEGRLCCALIRQKESDGTYRTVSLGFKNLIDEFKELRDLGGVENLVVLVDPETRRVFYVNYEEPSEILKFKEKESNEKEP